LSKEQLKSNLEELGILPGLLATAQRDLEKETLTRIQLEEACANHLNEIESLVCVNKCTLFFY